MKGPRTQATLARLFAQPHALVRYAELQFLRHFKPIVRIWRSWPVLVRSMLINLLIGLTVALGLFTHSDSEMIRKAEYAGIDWMQKQFRGAVPDFPERSVPFTLIDIDEETYREWGEPIFIPRDRLAGLIRYARENGAASIVVDVALDRPTADDSALLAEISQFSRPGNTTHLLLARTLVTQIEGESGLSQLRPSFLDAYYGPDHPFVHPASALFDVAEDGVVRFWRVWEPVCFRNGAGATSRPVALPSVQLTLLGLQHHKLEDIKRVLADSLPETCESSQTPPNRVINIDNQLSVHLGGDRLQKTIVYAIPWRLRPGERRPIVEWKGKAVPLLSKIPARRISGNPEFNEDLSGQIVIIGASHAEARDTHLTPLGEMPGAMVIVNSVHSMLQHGEIQSPNFYVKLLIQGILIVVMSLVFMRWASFRGTIISYLLIMVAILPFSLWLFKAGIWLDFALPLLAVQLYQVAKNYHEKLEEVRAEARLQVLIERGHRTEELEKT